MSEILSKAKVNKRMVYHYFGSKEGLYRAVHIQQWQVLSEWFAQELIPLGESGELNLRDLLLRAIAIFHEFCASHLEFIRLLMWDALEGGKISRNIWEESRGPIYRRIELLVKGAQQEGVLSEEFKVDHFIVTFMGATLFHFIAANTLIDIYGKNPLDPKMIEERGRQILTMLKSLTSGG